MGKELVISSNRHETKVAVLEDDQLVEVFFQRTNEYSLAGSIHKGRVTRVLPGMQSAFVDIGLERDAFLYVTDFFEEHEEYDRMAAPPEEKGRRTEKVAPPVPAPPAAAEAPAEERSQDPESRDRRSRRGRRRRNRGRGFPESKYVSSAGVTPAPEPEPVGEIQVLPGESLAKYQPDADGDTEGFPTEPEQVEAEAGTAAGDATVTEIEPEAELPEEAEAQAELLYEPEPLPEPVVPAEEPVPEAEALIPSPEGAAPPAEESAAEMPPEGRADVREPGPRYPHRLSRRLRRKVHGAAVTSEPRAPHHAHSDRAAKPESEEPKPAPSISDLLREGQEILVQIAKEPLGQKGARITSHIALPGRYVVYMPTVDHLGVSRKVASEEERLRLRRILHAHRTGMSGGFIVRTAGEGKSERDIAADMAYLYNLWLDLRQKSERRPAPAMIHHDLDVVQRLLRDQLAADFKAIWVDSEEVYESVLRFVERLQPDLVPRVKMYTRAVPVFDAFSITAELEKALRPKVWLKSGGYIVVNQTEALVAIDVNTGKFVGKSNRLEDTIVKTNTEAIREIVRQIRLRDLGGIIVVDFIDMDERKNRQKVMQALEEEMQRDRAPYKILQFNDFGLVAITRKRVKQSLERTLCAPCPYCEGAGYVKSVQTVVSEILQEAAKIAKAVEGPNVVLRVNPEVAKLLKSTDNDYLEELEEVLSRPVLVTGDAALHPEKWDMA
ncbi:MAG TPA: Rne/Rng family ribonuclease [Bryobacteraceae bacterium]|nr:Rne/Rng family ribonuclease [Bryobacteraceae bacterium]